MLASTDAYQWREPPEVAAASWDLFLRGERCALPLWSRVAATQRSLPDIPLRLLKQRATSDLQRVLSARAQLLLVREFAAARGIEPIVLKGGVVVGDDVSAVYLADLDVLCGSEADATVLDTLLADHGYRPDSMGTAFHLATRHVAGAIQVEVHYLLPGVGATPDLFARARPLAGVPGVWRLGPADHLWHLLVHSVVQHPFRRGCLRDELLIATAVAQCAPPELAELHARISRHPQREGLGAALELAGALANGRAGPDPFRCEAAAHYLLIRRFAWTTRWRLLDPLPTVVFVLLGSDADRRVAWADLGAIPEGPTKWQGLGALQRGAPWLGGNLRRALRAARLLLLRPLAWPIAVRARQLATRAGRASQPVAARQDPRASLSESESRRASA